MRRARLRCGSLSPMIDKRFFDELNERIGEAFRNSPAQDIEKNLKAMLASGFARLDLVLREDFEVQQKLLERAQQKLAELEARITELESRRRHPQESRALAGTFFRKVERWRAERSRTTKRPMCISSARPAPRSANSGVV